MGMRGGAPRTRTIPNYLHSSEWPEPRLRLGSPQQFYSQGSVATVLASDEAEATAQGGL